MANPDTMPTLGSMVGMVHPDHPDQELVGLVVGGDKVLTDKQQTIVGAINVIAYSPTGIPMALLGIRRLGAKGRNYGWRWKEPTLPHVSLMHYHPHRHEEGKIIEDLDVELVKADAEVAGG